MVLNVYKTAHISWADACGQLCLSTRFRVTQQAGGPHATYVLAWSHQGEAGGGGDFTRLNWSELRVRRYLIVEMTQDGWGTSLGRIRRDGSTGLLEHFQR
jgi:hypothetical protein